MSLVKHMAYMVALYTLSVFQTRPAPLRKEQKENLPNKQQPKFQHWEAKKEWSRKRAIEELQRQDGCTQPDPTKVEAAKKAQKKSNQ